MIIPPGSLPGAATNTFGESERMSPAQMTPLETAAAPSRGLRGGRDRDEWRARSGRARRGFGDAFDGVVSTSGHPVIALRSDL